MQRKKTRVIGVGKIRIGGDNPVVVQSMLKTDPQNLPATVNQMRELKRVGCEIVRMALPQESTCDAIPFLKREVDVPLIGDVHFNHIIALKAIELGIDGIRINPGTINNVRKVREIARLAAQKGTPVRIGINIGSLEKRILRKYGQPSAAAMVESALYYVKLFEDEGHREIKISLKASDVVDTIEAYRLFSAQSDYPLHVGITEAGPLFSGAIKSSVGIGILLAEGIGDTIRVSLTGNPVYEVAAAYLILRSLRMRERGINIISCPTCGRCKTSIQDIVEDFERETAHVETPLNVAIMGCEVNGPGEAKNADIGIAFGANKAVLFAKGALKRSDIPKEQAKDVLLEEIYNLTK
jgi:(E)-4-hydroxy-3-methylbut-2-enyl-diphosphate synthase